MADILTLLVRYLHILSGIVWIGSLGFSVMVLRRVVGRLDMPARKALMRQQIPVVIRFIPVSAVMTIVWGVVLYLVMGSFDPAVLWGTEWGRSILGALVLTLALFAFGILVVMDGALSSFSHLREDKPPADCVATFS